jgi:hypothetical protein
MGLFMLGILVFYFRCCCSLAEIGTRLAIPGL